MTPHAHDRRADSRNHFWAPPAVRFGRRKDDVTPSRPRVQPPPVDDGEELLRRLREAGL